MKFSRSEIGRGAHRWKMHWYTRGITCVSLNIFRIECRVTISEKARVRRLRAFRWERVEKEEENPYFFLPFLLGYCLWHLVCSIIMTPVGSAPTAADRSQAVEVVAGSSYDDRFRFPSPGEIYLLRKSSGGTLNSISLGEKKRRERRRRRNSDRGASFFSLSFCGFARYVFRSYERRPELRIVFCFVACLLYRKRRDSIVA